MRSFASTLPRSGKGQQFSWGEALAHFDWVLAGLVFAVLLFGVVMVGSASVAEPSVTELNQSNRYGIVIRQASYICIGLVLACFVFSQPVVAVQEVCLGLALCSLGLLIVVLLPGIGVSVNGAQRWLNLGVVNFQPSEFAKLALVLYAADYVTRQRSSLQHTTEGFVRPLLIIALASALLIGEPDFGAIVVISSTIFMLLFIGGARLTQFITLIVCAAGLGTMAILLADYRLGRVTSFIDPWDDPFKSDFQLTQSLIAIGSGSWSGVGLGNSVQKLHYLPEAETDFVFSVFAEEWGLRGVIIFVMLFSLLVVRIWQIGMNAEKMNQSFAALSCYGIAFLFGFQAFINIGVTLGLLPTKGITLPMISAGGSSMLICLVALAYVARVAAECNRHGVSMDTRRSTASRPLL